MVIDFFSRSGPQPDMLVIGINGMGRYQIYPELRGFSTGTFQRKTHENTR
jgi:hypothetical protein